MTKELLEKTSMITKDSLLSIGVVIAMISVAVWMASSHESMKSQLHASEQKINDLSKIIERQEEDLAAHKKLGINGYPHPEGIMAEVNKIREEMSGKTADRWKKIDDFLFMKSFCEVNKLQMPPHITADVVAATGEVGKK